MSEQAFSRKLSGGAVRGFIDTHCHILPGVDDGPAAAAETSLAMARLAVADGITTIVATPHIIEGYIMKTTIVRCGWKNFERALLRSSGIALKLVAGAEVPMSACLAGDGERLKSLTIGGGRYLLMETADTTFDQVAQAAYQVRLWGLFPILAHPERVAFVQEHPERLSQILDRSGMMHLIASDAHSTGVWSPRLSASYAVQRDEFGEAAARVIMLANPAHVLDGSRLERVDPGRGGVSKRRALARLFRKR